MSYLLDTNVVSEAAKRQPNPRVMVWLKKLSVREAYLSVLTLGELVQGAVRAPEPRRAVLESWIEDLKRRFDGQILPLDIEVMEAWGALTGGAMNEGRPLSPLDALLAATALCHGLILVTRNTTHFRGLPIRLLNPWEG
ncbi:type II toxin-antitoxin system VapC family toxin [Meiothermus sp. CFH 77666]|uniref:type II toxin-antitoxin system VapC family toxin n=1 Tax=Meiothermus sp. CFH 77666 TaxID=2817942 RepID=UPI001AA04C04|nr:type II toxin-antitoxin system VapC family toxin [Meiothermus sp. CFH 77666]MBO1438452.1 type II toxin-antitoxin system VapC family toxin [Meiothermus sp. CFH 77666]